MSEETGDADSLVRAASASLQAHEQLCHLVTSGGMAGGVPVPGEGEELHAVCSRPPLIHPLYSCG